MKNEMNYQEEEYNGNEDMENNEYNYYNEKEDNENNQIYYEEGEAEGDGENVEEMEENQNYQKYKNQNDQNRQINNEDEELEIDNSNDIYEEDEGGHNAMNQMNQDQELCEENEINEDNGEIMNYTPNNNSNKKNNINSASKIQNQNIANIQKFNDDKIKEKNINDNQEPSISENPNQQQIENKKLHYDEEEQNIEDHNEEVQKSEDEQNEEEELADNINEDLNINMKENNNEIRNKQMNNDNQNLCNANNLKDNSSYQNNQSSHYSMTTNNNVQFQRIKPRYYKLLTEVISNNFEMILDYLDLLDLCNVRSINHLFLTIMHEYYQKRLKFEINLIINYQEQNKEKTNIFMKDIDSQIPISNKNWLDFDLQSITKKLKLFNRNLITKLKSIKSIGKLNDCIYAPFCIIFGQNKNKMKNSKNTTWKSIANKILNEPNLLLKIPDLDIENMADDNILNAFVFLNLNELDIDLIRKFSHDFANFITWCQGVVSYHILIHPYTIRNAKGSLSYNEEIFKYAETMNYMINRFYKFKRFLYNINIMKIPLADYVFNLQHNREVMQIQENYAAQLSENNIANILSYIPYVNSFKYMIVSRKFYNGFKLSINLRINEILKEIYLVKAKDYNKMNIIVPIVYSNNIFSKYFIMLDEILHSQCNENGMSFIPFLTREQLSDLKKIKSRNINVNKIAKIFCIICDEKPNKKTNLKGDSEYLWLDRLKLLVLNGKLLKTMRNLNQLCFTEEKIKSIDQEISEFYCLAKLEEIKKINFGIYQLLIWELYVYEYLKIYNPFDFIDSDYIANRYEQEEVDVIKYYIDILKYLKYHLKLKFHFSTSNLSGNNNLNPVFNFGKMAIDLKNTLYGRSDNIEGDPLFSSTDDNFNKIADVFFDSVNLISFVSKPSLYEKILVEILNCREKEILGVQQGYSSKSNINEYNQDTSNLNNDMVVENNKVNLNSNNNNKQFANIEGENSFSANKKNSNLNNNTNNLLQNNYLNQNNNNNISINSNSLQNTTYIKNNLNNMRSLFSKNISNPNSPLSLMDIPDYLIIKNILFYLDINSLPKFALINRKSNDCFKTHIFIRLFFLNKERKVIESENNELISNITNSRNDFYTEYEIPKPLKAHALSMINKITNKDLMEIKQCFKKYNKNYETIIEPLMVILGEKAYSKIKPDGTKLVSVYQTAKKVLFKIGFSKRIKDLELETIDNNIILNVEKLLENPCFNDDKIKFLSPCLVHLVSWIKGVVEFHRFIRKYSLTTFDFEILNESQINFCAEMDNIVLLYYKLLRYVSKYCKNYEPFANQIMEMMKIDI